ncbi:MAG TPA: RDD family protein [Gammaproteobacteria bacterium]|nr:RDD family protein [Gammaproteobacteria bacterium]
MSQTETGNAAAAPRPAGLGRRLAALVYDSLLLLAVLFLASWIALAVNRGEAVAPGNPFFEIYLFVICYLFFGWFWTHGGQTLGMRAWRIRVQRLDGYPINWTQSLLRFMPVLLVVLLRYLPEDAGRKGLIVWGVVVALGHLWLLVDRKGMSLYDRYSDSVVVYLPPAKPSADVRGT